MKRKRIQKDAASAGGRLYSREHLWLTFATGTATIGVTAYIAGQLGEPRVYSLPDPGTRITRGQVFAEIEAAKVLCDLAAPVSGRVVEINAALGENPALVVDRPDETWLMRVADLDPGEFKELLTEHQYQVYLKGSSVTHPLRKRFGAPKRQSSTPRPFS